MGCLENRQSLQWNGVNKPAIRSQQVSVPSHNQTKAAVDTHTRQTLEQEATLANKKAPTFDIQWLRIQFFQSCSRFYTSATNLPPQAKKACLGVTAYQKQM